MHGGLSPDIRQIFFSSVVFFPPFNKSENFIRFSDLGPYSNFAMDLDPDLLTNELTRSGFLTYAGLMCLNLNIKFQKPI